MNDEQQKSYNRLERYFKNFNIKEFLKLDDANYGLRDAEQHFEELVYWIKRFFKNKSYIDKLPAYQLATILNAMNDTRRSVETISDVRENDPTQYKANKSDYVQDLENRYNDIYQYITVPLRSYLAIERGSLAEISKSAEESLQNVRQSEEAIENVEEARREASADEAASENAKHFNDLAKKYNSSKNKWFWAFWIYIAVWLAMIGVVYVKSQTIRDALKDFDVTNVPAYVLKIVLIAIFAFGLNFISRNYNARLMLEIAAETRATRLKTWRAFISAPELNGHDRDIVKIKADVVLEIAKVIFSDIPSGLEKGKTKIFEAPISITNKKP